MFEFRLTKTYKGKKVRFLFDDIEPQEVVLDVMAKKNNYELGAPDIKAEVPLSKAILKGFFVFSALIIAVFFVFTFQLMVRDHEKYVVLAEQNKFIVRAVESFRGVIYDIKGNQIVSNRPSFNLILNKEDLPKDDSLKEEIYNKVAGIIGEDINLLKDKVNKGKSSGKTLIAEIIDHQKLIILETRISELAGFVIEKSAVREYKDGPMYSHIIGYTGTVNDDDLKDNPDGYFAFDQIGRAGLEKTYEEVLKRNPGQVKIERDVYGNQISKEILSLPQSGGSLVLWLDSDLQKKIESEIKKRMEEVGATKAMGIAMNPKTGGVMALVNIPEYDNNLFSQKKDSDELKALLTDKTEPLLNRVIAGKYVTGSSIKPFLASAALQEKLISPDKIIDDRGYISIKNKYDSSIVYKYTGITPHGLVDMRKALAVSSNIYFYTIGGGYENQKGLGPARIKKYLDLFGWEEKTGIDIPNECAGFVPSPEWKKSKKGEGWWDGDTYNISIGQGDIGVTPIEVINAYAAIANGGTLYKPKVAKQIVDDQKNNFKEISPEILRQNFIDPANLEIVREGMRLAVTAIDTPHASCKSLNDLPVDSACKTGTAQTSLSEHYHNWITVFAPYDDPEIIITLMIENVDKQMATVISPAKEILRWYFTENIKPAN